MQKRTIYIGNPAQLKQKERQLKIFNPTDHILKGSIPIEDIGVLCLDHPQITFSHYLLRTLMDYNVVVISCDEQHLPSGLFLPMVGHTVQTEHFRYQIELTETMKNQLWKQTVYMKIENQSKVLAHFQLPYTKLRKYLERIEEGDRSNIEARAAQYYWKTLFEDFSRHRFGDYPNNLLNYGYAILRSVVARSIVGSGLLPSLGIFHRNRYNPFCLADDLMEPYRPMVDLLVCDLVEDESNRTESLTTELKKQLLQIPVLDVDFKGRKSPLMVGSTRTTASLVACLKGEKRKISYPSLCTPLV